MRMHIALTASAILLVGGCPTEPPVTQAATGVASAMPEPQVQPAPTFPTALDPTPVPSPVWEFGTGAWRMMTDVTGIGIAMACLELDTFGIRVWDDGCDGFLETVVLSVVSTSESFVAFDIEYSTGATLEYDFARSGPDSWVGTCRFVAITGETGPFNNAVLTR